MAGKTLAAAAAAAGVSERAARKWQSGPSEPHARVWLNATAERLLAKALTQ